MSIVQKIPVLFGLESETFIVKIEIEELFLDVDKGGAPNSGRLSLFS